MTQTRIMELRGSTYATTVKVDWLFVAGLLALAWGLVALVLDLRPELLAAILRLVRG
jgi:hypothetical protein